MNWYLAKIVYQIICGDGDHTPQFDEQLRLIEADNQQQAFYKAQQIGVLEQDKFFNNDMRLVQWKFIDVNELYPLNNLIDGAEIYSRIQETDDADNYIRMVQQKADQLEGSSILETIQAN
jgi:Domain of unknown function (DUF4288)